MDYNLSLNYKEVNYVPDKENVAAQQQRGAQHDAAWKHCTRARDFELAEVDRGVMPLDREDSWGSSNDHDSGGDGEHERDPREDKRRRRDRDRRQEKEFREARREAKRQAEMEVRREAAAAAVAMLAEAQAGSLAADGGGAAAAVAVAAEQQRREEQRRDQVHRFSEQQHQFGGIGISREQQQRQQHMSHIAEQRGFAPLGCAVTTHAAGPALRVPLSVPVHSYAPRY